MAFKPSTNGEAMPKGQINPFVANKGGSKGGENMGGKNSGSLLVNVSVKEVIQKAMSRREKRTEITQNRVLLNLTGVKSRQDYGKV